LNILITGTSGFLGSNLKTLFLNKSNKVFVGSRSKESKQDTININTSNPRIIQDLSSNEVECVVVVGSADTPTDDIIACNNLIDGNIKLPTFLLSAASSAGVKRFIHIGSSWQNYKRGNFHPFNLYASSKEAFYPLAQHFHLKYPIMITSLQLFDTYGPMDSRRKILNLIAESFIFKRPLDLSPGKQKLNLLHVSDVCSAVEKSLILGKNKSTFNKFIIRDEVNYDLFEIAEIFQELGHSSLLNFGGRDYRPGEIMYPQSDLPLLPGWTPKIDLRTGIRELIQNLKV
jgi:CDP-paratose synthetase